MRYARADRRCAVVGAVLVLALAQSMTSVLAQSASPQLPESTIAAPSANANTVAEPIARGDAVILELRVNDVKRGEIMVLIDSEADSAETTSIWLGAAMFEALGIDPGRLPRSALDGQDYVYLQASERVGIALDLDALRLSLRFAPELLGKQTINLSTGADTPPSPTLPAHAWLDYDVSVRGDARQWAVGADLAANVALAGWTFRSEHVAATGDAGGSMIRTRSFAERDWPQQMVRASLGDLLPARLPFGRIGAISGLRVARRFDLRPGFAAPPPFSYSGTVETPSTAEIYLDGALLRTVPIAPGRYEMRDLTYFSGLRDVRIVIADAFGGRREILIPHYFSDDPLRRGLHEFEYTLGVPRNGDGGTRADGGITFTGSHRYGINEHLTVGAGVEATSDYRAWSIDASWVLGRAGTFRGHYTHSASALDDVHSDGAAMLLGYSFSVRGLSFSISDWRQDLGFGDRTGDRTGDASIPISGLAPKRRSSVDMAFALPAQQSMAVSLGRDQRHSAPSTDQMSLRYSARLFGAMSLSARYTRSRSAGRTTNEASLGLQFQLGRGWSGSAGIERGPSRERRVLAVDRGQPEAGGWGGRALLEDDGTGRRLETVVGRDLHVGTLTAMLRHRQGGASSASTAGALQFSGALAQVGGDLHAARPIRDAFALVDASGLAGVRVYRNNTLAGTTDREGRLLLPGLGAYTRNQIRLDDRDIPIEVQLEAITTDAVPRARIGADIRFRAQRIISAGGRLRFVGPNGAVMVTAATLRTTVDGRAVETSTGPDGDFYLDSLIPGEFVLEARNASIACTARMRIAEGAPAFTDIGEVDCASAP